jgi:hypothetical protein
VFQSELPWRSRMSVVVMLPAYPFEYWRHPATE